MSLPRKNAPPQGTPRDALTETLRVAGDNRTQRGHHEVDLNDLKQTFASAVVPATMLTAAELGTRPVLATRSPRRLGWAKSMWDKVIVIREPPSANPLLLFGRRALA